MVEQSQQVPSCLGKVCPQVGYDYTVNLSGQERLGDDLESTRQPIEQTCHSREFSVGEWAYRQRLLASE